jgi:hypothetical protein
MQPAEHDTVTDRQANEQLVDGVYIARSEPTKPSRPDAGRKWLTLRR